MLSLWVARIFFYSNIEKSPSCDFKILYCNTCMCKNWFFNFIEFVGVIPNKEPCAYYIWCIYSKSSQAGCTQIVDNFKMTIFQKVSRRQFSSASSGITRVLLVKLNFYCSSNLHNINFFQGAVAGGTSFLGLQTKQRSYIRVRTESDMLYTRNDRL